MKNPFSGMSFFENIKRLVDIVLSESAEDKTNLMHYSNAPPSNGDGMTPVQHAPSANKASRNQSSADALPDNMYTIVYRGGHIVDVQPMPPGDIYDNRDIIYSAVHIVSDGQPYDLSDKTSIASIKAPYFRSFPRSAIAETLGVTGTFDYVLRMRAARFWNEGRYDISIPLLEKATKIMQVSDIGWHKRDYYRIVNELVDLGMLRRAEWWVQWIDEKISDDLSTNAADKELRPDIKQLLSEALYLKTDLVESSGVLGCCEKCAKYRNRIFSLSGIDSRFPRLPSDFHENCGITLSPFIYGVMEPTFAAKDVVRYSNRPFFDDRTQEEKDAYQNRISRISNMQRNLIYPPDPVRTSYYLIKKFLPSDAPKSMGGYRRMYNSRSKNFQKLIIKANEIGLTLPETTDDLLELEASGVFL